MTYDDSEHVSKDEGNGRNERRAHAHLKKALLLKRSRHALEGAMQKDGLGSGEEAARDRRGALVL
jgi:hypothetical protein